MDTTLFHKAYEQIKNASNVLVVTHDKPDGDAISSACLIAELLETLHKPHSIYCFDQPHQQFNFLPHLEKFITRYDQFDYDLVVALDCGSFKRTNLDETYKTKSRGRFIIEFDHHPKIDDYADLELRNPEAASTTEVLYHFIKSNKIKINKNLANCILTGLLTDTANFLYPATSSDTINIASEMLRNGARLPRIMESTWRNKSIASMKTWGRAMNNLQINKKFNFASTVLRQEDIGDDVTEEEMDGMAGFLSNLHNVKGILILREQKDGSIKGSLRTAHPEINVSRLARLFGGGGHAKASGFVVKGKLELIDNVWKIV